MVSDQNGISLLYVILEIHHSGWEPLLFSLKITSPSRVNQPTHSPHPFSRGCEVIGPWVVYARCRSMEGGSQCGIAAPWQRESLSSLSPSRAPTVPPPALSLSSCSIDIVCLPLKTITLCLLLNIDCGCLTDRKKGDWRKHLIWTVTTQTSLKNTEFYIYIFFLYCSSTLNSWVTHTYGQTTKRNQDRQGSIFHSTFLQPW